MFKRGKTVLSRKGHDDRDDAGFTGRCLFITVQLCFPFVFPLFLFFSVHPECADKRCSSRWTAPGGPGGSSLLKEWGPEDLLCFKSGDPGDRPCFNSRAQRIFLALRMGPG